MMYKFKWLLFICAFIATISFAHPPVHTWHTISTTNGLWEGKLQMLNESGVFVTPDHTLLFSFVISPDQSQDYGFRFAEDADFDIAYTLTLIQKPAMHTFKTLFQSKTCVYVITAKGPAQPDIRANSYNDATCHFEIVHGKGENFMVS